MKNKKLIALSVLSLSLLLPCLSSCGNDNTPTSNPSSETPTTSEQAPTSEEVTSEESSEITSSSLKDKYECISIEEALTLATQAGSSGTSERYYIYGRIETVSDPTYGEMTITDGTHSIYVYGTYGSDGEARYSELDEKPVAGDDVVIYALLSTYNDSPQVKSGWIMDFVHNEPEINIEDYQETTILNARSVSKGAKVKLTGVVATITYADGMIPNGVYLVDETSSIYVYGQDLAGQVKKGNTITVAGEKDYWILESEQGNAKKFGYGGCNQISNPILLENDKGTTDFNKSWIEESTVKEILNTPFSEDITTKIYKVNAFINKVEGSGFTNYYINDIDGVTGQYSYSQASGNDFSWLDEFDGKICTVYLAAHNAKSTASSAFYRFVPVHVEDNSYSFDLAKAGEFAIEYFAKDQFKVSYNANPDLELVTSASSLLLGIDNVTLSYTSSNTDVLFFQDNEGKLILKINEVDIKTEVTITIKATFHGVETTKDIKVLVEPKIVANGISVKEAIDSEDGSEVQVEGIVLSSLVNRSGFYIIDETGVVAVLMDADALKDLAPGNHVVIKGTKTHWKKETSTAINGQTCIKDATLVVNNYGEHEIPENHYVTNMSIADLYNTDPAEDWTTKVFVVQGIIELVETPFYTNIKITSVDGEAELNLYCSGAGQFSQFFDLANKEVTLEIMLCNWNDKNYYRGCIVSATDGTTTIVNTLNFDN